MKRRPKTGEPRQVNQPLRLDSLPQAKRDQIISMRRAGESWERIAKAVGEPATTLHRWYDLRVAQVMREVQQEGEWSRQIAQALAGPGYESLPDAVRNAIADQLFGVMQASEPKERAQAAEALIGFMDQLTKRERVEVQKQKIGIEREKLALVRSKLQGLKKDVAGTGTKKQLSKDELQQRLDDIYGITG